MYVFMSSSNKRWKCLRSRKLQTDYKRSGTLDGNPWSMHGVSIARIIELDISLLLFPHASPARCCIISTAWLNPHRNLLKWKTDSAWAAASSASHCSLPGNESGTVARMGVKGWGWKRVSWFWNSQEDWGPSVRMEFIMSTKWWHVLSFGVG